MKKIFFTILSYIYILQANASLKESMLPNNDVIKNVGVSNQGTGVISQVLIYVKDFLFSILVLIAVGVFLYFGFKIITSRGNEEEFKKALMGFLYAVIGLAIIPLAWTAVKLITTLKF